MSNAFANRRAARGHGVTTLKFVISAFVCSALWLAVLAWNWGTPPTEIPTFVSQDATGTAVYLMLAGVMSLASLPAVFVHIHSPDEYVDLYHRLGALSAIFVAVNIPVMIAAVSFTVYGPTGVDLIGISVFWALAAVFVPGPYIGALIGARWSR